MPTHLQNMQRIVEVFHEVRIPTAIPKALELYIAEVSKSVSDSRVVQKPQTGSEHDQKNRIEYLERAVAFILEELGLNAIDKS